MDVRNLHYFLTAVREGSIMGAAKVLHMTQPPLSRAITQLERELGVRLLVRSKRGVVPTLAGEYLVTEGKRLLDTMDSITRHVGNMQSGLEGHVAIASIPSLSWDVLPPILHRFTTEVPKAEITLSTGPPLMVVDAVMSRAADIGLLAIHDVSRLSDDLRRGLGMYRVHGGLDGGTHDVVMALPMRLSAMPDPIDVVDLQDEMWIVPFGSSRVPSLRELAEDVWREAGMSYPRVHEVSMMRAGIPLIAAGIGVGFMSNSHFMNLEKSIVFRSTRQRLPKLDLMLLWSKTTALSPVIRRFLTIAGQVHREAPTGDQSAT